MTTAIVPKKKTRRTRLILFILLPILLILVLGFSILCAVRIRKKIIKLDGVCGDGNSLWEAAFMKRCSEIIPKLEDKILVT